MRRRPLSVLVLLTFAALGGCDTGGGLRAGTPGAGGGSGGVGVQVGDAAAGAGGATADAGVGNSSACATALANLPAEPTIPAACATLTASFAVVAGTPPDESALDTSRIQSALSACSAGQAVQLTTSGANNGFITGPISVPSGVTLWVDAGVTLFGTRNPTVYGNASALIMVKGTGSGVMGEGVIDGQGGEPQIGGTQTWWDVNGSGGSSPALIQVSSASNFTLYKITLNNSPMFHVKLSARGFIVWGVTIKTPSRATNSVGTQLNPSAAHNTDGIDPGESASNGFILYSKISDGDDHVAIKGGSGVNNVTIAHNHFGAGHGMSIGSETNGGVSNIAVCDLTIDGLASGFGGGSSNGLRIKSDPSRGGLVSNVTYDDVCVRNLANPILLTPLYSATTGTLIPQYTGIIIRNFHSVASTVNPSVTLLGYDAAHMLGLSLDNVVVDGLTAGKINASNAAIVLGPGQVSFTPAGTNVMVMNNASAPAAPNDCTNRWVTF
jgi:polygalacturonase